MGIGSTRMAFDLAEMVLDRQVALHLDAVTFRPLTRRMQLEGPCVYLLRYKGRHGLYRVVPHRPVVVYVGSAQRPHRRLNQHRKSLSYASDLEVCDFEVGAVRVSSPEMSRYVEARLIRLIDPPWNRTDFAGFGSGPQGRVREAGQRSSRWDQLHPGRPWAARATAMESGAADDHAPS